MADSVTAAANAPPQQGQNAAKTRRDVHIRVQQRNGRKCITTLQGLDIRYDCKRLAGEFKTRWGCNGSVINDKEAGMVIQLQGNMSDHLREFIMKELYYRSEQIKVFK